MKILSIIFFSLFLACSPSKEKTSTKKNDPSHTPVTLDTFLEEQTREHGAFTLSKEQPTDTESLFPSDDLNSLPEYTPLEEDLIQLKDDFFSYLKKGQYSDAQSFLHPDGVFFYTLGKIPSNEFSFQTLQTKKGPLMGTYLSGGYGPAGNQIDSILVTDDNGHIVSKQVPGTYWLDSMLTNFSLFSPYFYNAYHVEAYGSSGNHSSDHEQFDVFFDFDERPLFNGKPIIVMDIMSNTCKNREILMIEFFQDDLGNWKIYAIGNKEWTP